MKVGNLFLLFLLSISFIQADNVKVGIVGYTLIDEFRIMTNPSVKLIIDDREYEPENLLITDNTVIGDTFTNSYSNITIKNSDIIYFLSDKGLQPYRGDIYITYDRSMKIINEVDENYYFASVLGSEMGSTFHKEALKAQLLAIKAFFQNRKELNRHKTWDILNTSRVMAYRGEEYVNEYLYSLVEEIERIDLSMPQGLEPMFFSTASGFILSQDCLHSKLGEQPEIIVINNNDNTESPYYSFELTVTMDKLEDVLKDHVTGFYDIELIYFKDTPCVDYIGFINENKTTWLKGYQFVSIMQKNYGVGFKSIQFDISINNNEIYFTGNGFGHFIGLSQYGANEMAVSGFKYDEILEYYYPGIQLEY